MIIEDDLLIYVLFILLDIKNDLLFLLDSYYLIWKKD